MTIDQEPASPEPVEEAARALRRGEAVRIAAEGMVLPVVAAEMARPGNLASLGAPLAAYLTHARAQTLKIRLYTPDAVAVALRKEDPAAMARHLADPTLDIAQPLSGPFRARRAPLPPQIPAALQLLKLAGLLPAAVAPAAARPLAPDERADLSVSDIEAYRERALRRLSYVTAAEVPLADAPKARIMAFRPGDGGPESLAIIIGEPDLEKPVLVRLHSECFTGDLLGSLKCDCGDQLRGAIRRMGEEGSGILLYLAQEGRGIGLMNKLRAYALQDQGYDTMEANERLGFAADERVFDLAAAMLKTLGVRSVRLLTNNPDKVQALKDLGIDVAERVPHAFPANAHNERYLLTKAKKGGHAL